MLKLQEYINCFDNIQEASVYLQRNLDINTEFRQIGNETAGFRVYHFSAGQRADLKNPLVREANCLIMYDDGEVAAKAWNYPFIANTPEEMPACFNPSKAVCEELPDGVIVIIYNIEGRWHVGTKGSIDGDDYLPGAKSIPAMTYAHEIKALLSRRFNGIWDTPFKNTNPYMCFVFSYVSPYGNNVMPIMSPNLYLMSVINMEAGIELSNGFVESIGTKMGLPRRQWSEINGSSSLSQRLHGMRALAPGLLLTDVEGYRVFVPNPIYKAVWTAKQAGDMVRPTHVARILQACRDKADIIAIQAAYNDFGTMLMLLWTTREELWKELLILWSTAKKAEDLKEFAGIVQHHPLNYLMFMFRNKELTSFKEAVAALKPIKLARLTKNRYEKEYETASRLLKYNGGNTHGVSEKESGEEEGSIPFGQEGD